MKYLKYNEYHSNRKFYWLLPTDNRFRKSLKAIGCPEVNILYFIKNEQIKKDYYVFILLDNTNAKVWGWNQYKGEPRDDYSEKHNYNFKGLVNIEEYELAANKYNL